MTNSPKSDKSKELKLHFTISEIEAIDKFKDTWLPGTSRNKLFHTAIDYYMTKLRESNGIRGIKDFPVDVAAEDHTPYIRGKPAQKHKGAE